MDAESWPLAHLVSIELSEQVVVQLRAPYTVVVLNLPEHVLYRTQDWLSPSLCWGNLATFLVDKYPSRFITMIEAPNGR